MSRREREILQILHRLGEATAAEIHEALEHPPTYSAVRATLRILEEKQHVVHVEDGKRYVYRPAQAKEAAARNALDQLLTTFFGGNLEGVVQTFLSEREHISDDELDRLTRIIEEARTKEGHSR